MTNNKPLKRKRLKASGVKRIKRFFKLGENEKDIIKVIGLGAIAISSLAFPNLPLVLKPILNDRGDRGFRKLLDHLVDKKIIILGDEKVELTIKGREIFEKMQIEEIKIEKPKNWDGIWHLASYDIPRKLNKARDQLRFTLKKWGFQQVQASLWVYPYPCREELAILAKFLNLNPYIIYMNTDSIPYEEDMIKLFDL